MKTIYSTMLLSCALFVGCTNDELVSDAPLGGEGIIVTASIDGNNSRTSYTEADGVIKTTWNTGDAIGLCVEKGQTNLKYTAAGDGATTAFYKDEEALDAADGTTVYAYYPQMPKKNGLTKDGETKEEYVGKEEVLVNTPMLMNQIYQADNIASSGQWQSGSYYPIHSMDFIYASGTVQNGKLNFTKFNHAFAFIKLTIEAGALLGDASRITAAEMDNAPEGDYYKIKIIGDNITTWTYGGPLFNLKDKRFASVDLWNEISYFINAEDFDGTKPLTCYIAVLPGNANKTIEIKTDNGKELAISKTIPAGGLKSGTVYPVTLKAPEASNDPNGVEGYYELSYTTHTGYSDQLTVTLTKTGENTYEWKKFTMRDDMSVTLTYSPEDETLTMNAGQKIADGSELYFVNASSGFFTANRDYQYWDPANSPNQYVSNEFVTKDNTVTYVAKKSIVDGKTVFTFEDGGTWGENQVYGLLVAKESKDENYDLECTYSGSCTLNPVLTKK